MTPLVGCLGDLVSDVVVELGQTYRPGTDTAASITAHRGGSAANVAAAVRVCGSRARFIGRVGDGERGDGLLAELAGTGVELAVVRGGCTGTVIVLVHPGGERSLITDRGASGQLEALPDGALDGLSALHVPLYAIEVEPLASTAGRAIRKAAARGALTSVDASSVRVVEHLGAGTFIDWCARAGAGVLFCNADEATAIGRGRFTDLPVVIEKRGSRPAVLYAHGRRTEVPARAVDAVDTTGAGDAFAAAALIARCEGADWFEAVEAGHGLAARAVTTFGALTGNAS